MRPIVVDGRQLDWRAAWAARDGSRVLTHDDLAERTERSSRRSFEDPRDASVPLAVPATLCAVLARRD